MKRFLDWVQDLVPDAKAVIRRFPLAVLMVTALTLAIIIKQNLNGVSEESLLRIISGTVLAAYVSVILTLVGEGRERSVGLPIKIAAVITALGLGWYFRSLGYLPQLAIGSAILFLGNAPFWRSSRHDEAVWNFTHKLWAAVIFTVAGSLLYAMGLYFITAALKSLFSVNVKDLMENWMLPIGLGFLAPMAWLSMLPEMNEDDSDSLRNPGFISRAVGFLGTWILAPLTLIFAVILLAYGVKIALMQSLPKGEIGGLATPFLIIGSLTWLILDPPFIQAKRLARWFKKLWFPIVIPAAILLGVASFVRIAQYGWTIERYLLVLISVWGLGLGLWFTFRSEEARDIRIIPGFAALLLALASIGPWGADSVSTMNQNARLKSAIIANAMLSEDGYLLPTDEIKLADNDQAVKSKGALEYLIKNRKKNKIESYFDANETIELIDSSSINGRLNYTVIINRFAFDKVWAPNGNNKQNRYWYGGSSDAISVADYDFISPLQSRYTYGKRATNEQSYDIGSVNVSLGENNAIVKIDNAQKSIFPIVDWLKNQPTNDRQEIELNPHHILYEDGSTVVAIHIVTASYDTVNEFSTIDYFILTKGIKPD